MSLISIGTLPYEYTKGRKVSFVKSNLQRIDYNECPRNQNWLRREVRTVKVIDNEGEWFCFDEVS